MMTKKEENQSPDLIVAQKGRVGSAVQSALALFGQKVCMQMVQQ